MEHRPLTLGLAGGSLSSLVWNFFTDFADRSLHRPPTTSPSVPLDCVCPPTEFLDWEFDLRSLFAGVLVGIAVGPLLEALLVLRQWWSNLVRRQLAAVSRSVRPLYREL